MVIHPFQAWWKEWKSMAGMRSSIFPIPGLRGSRWPVAVHMLHMIVIVHKVPRKLEMRMVMVIHPFQVWSNEQRIAWLECGRAFFPFQSWQALDDLWHVLCYGGLNFLCALVKAVGPVAVVVHGGTCLLEVRSKPRCGPEGLECGWSW